MPGSTWRFETGPVKGQSRRLKTINMCPWGKGGGGMKTGRRGVGGGGLGRSKGEQTGNWEVNHRTGDFGGRDATSTL